MRLKAPVDNQHRAFCCRGCYQQFYRTRCLVCERDIRTDPLTGKARSLINSHRKFCTRRCLNSHQHFPHVFAFRDPSAVSSAAEPRPRALNADKTEHLIGPQDWPIMVIGPRLPNHRPFPAAPTVLAAELPRLRPSSAVLSPSDLKRQGVP
jgi:hypothetical protein